ncbi:hypothetical protein G6F31_019323 [Rhizopus arrhizus]|nr:hypothetical protein G6F31_019323 [Rhizopus arrhizus]
MRWAIASPVARPGRLGEPGAQAPYRRDAGVDGGARGLVGPRGRHAGCGRGLERGWQPAGAGGAGSGFQGFVHRRGEGAQHQSVLRAGLRPVAQHDGGRGRAGVAPAVHAVLRRAAAL